MPIPWNENATEQNDITIKKINRLKLPMSEWIRDKELVVPTMPQVLAKAMRMASDPSTTVSEIEKLIEKDQAVAGRLLSIANSAFFSRGVEAKTIKDAIVRIGQDELKNNLFSLFVQTRLFTSEIYNDLIGALWRHSLGVAEISRRLCEQGLIGNSEIKSDEGFLAGLLHDVGKAALIDNMGERILDKADYSSHIVEEAIEPLHELAGGIVLQSWGISKEISDAVMGHHHLERAKDNRQMALLVHIADLLAFKIGIGILEPGQQIEDHELFTQKPLLAKHLAAKEIDLATYEPLAELGISFEEIQEFEQETSKLMENIEGQVFSVKKNSAKKSSKIRSAYKSEDPKNEQTANKSNAKLYAIIAFLLLGVCGVLAWLALAE